jgi:ribosomal-protein-alanine N-acetyltransferase
MESRPLKRAVLTGERVVVRPIAASDARAAFQLLHGNDRILRWLVWDGPRSEKELREAYARWSFASERGEDYRLAVLDAESEDFVGGMSVRFAGHPETGDVGYWIGEPYWGRGYATEAVRLVSHLAFRHVGAETLCASVFVGNLASRIVLERNGYSLLRTAHGQTQKAGLPVDEWLFVLLRSEWVDDERGWRPVREEVELAAPGGDASP